MSPRGSLSGQCSGAASATSGKRCGVSGSGMSSTMPANPGDRVAGVGKACGTGDASRAGGNGDSCAAGAGGAGGAGSAGGGAGGAGGCTARGDSGGGGGGSGLTGSGGTAAISSRGRGSSATSAVSTTPERSKPRPASASLSAAPRPTRSTAMPTCSATASTKDETCRPRRAGSASGGTLKRGPASTTIAGVMPDHIGWRQNRESRLRLPHETSATISRQGTAGRP
jgi:hypothetical protein